MRYLVKRLLFNTTFFSISRILKAKDHKADLQGLDSHMHAAREYRKEKLRYEEQEKDLKETINNLEAKRKEAAKIMADAVAIVNASGDLEAELSDARIQREKLESIVAKQRLLLSEDLTKSHDIASLEKMERSYDEEMAGQSTRQRELEDQLQQVQNRIDELQRHESELQSKKGRYEAGKDAHVQRLEDRFGRMESLRSTYRLDGISASGDADTSQANMSYVESLTLTSWTQPDESGNSSETSKKHLSISAEDMSRFMRSLAKKENDLENEVGTNRRSAQAEEDRIQRELTDLSNRISTKESGKDLYSGSNV
jgi:hypothetical protein